MAMSRRVWLQLLVLCVVCLAVSDSKKAKKKGPPAVLTVSKLTPCVLTPSCVCVHILGLQCQRSCTMPRLISLLLQQVCQVRDVHGDGKDPIGASE